jgi:hypothetical protein
MKGIELPINVLIIVAVAIIVLIALVAMFYPNFKSSSTVVNSDIYKSSACQIMIDRKCTPSPSDITIANFDADKNGKQDSGSGWTFSTATTSLCAKATNTNKDNLASLCDCYYSITNENSCKALCGCTV